MKTMNFYGGMGRLQWMISAALMATGLAPSAAFAQVHTTLASFDVTQGANPIAGLIADANGNLFGTTTSGGASGNGTVFQIVKTAKGYASTPISLVNFNGANGALPIAGLIADANGNLFGTASQGGTLGYGTVFEVVKTATGYATTPTVLVNFDLTNGAGPLAGLIADANGNLFGTTAGGGAFGGGAVYEIVKTATGYASTLVLVASFDGANGGSSPQAGLLADATGNLFGTTVVGGAYGAGTVYEILKTAGGYASVPIVLVNFDGTKGGNPEAGLIADTNGNLYGTTFFGGAFGGGTVFEVMKTGATYAATPTILFNFDDTNGANPWGGLLADADGNLFGTAQTGGPLGAGVVFKIAKTAGGYAGTPHLVGTFRGGETGGIPYSFLIADASGNLFGTTIAGGAFDVGTVFEVTGSGFVPPVRFSGTPGTPNCVGVSTSTLAHTYGGIGAAAKALGYASVADLQSAVSGWCGSSK